MSVTKSPIPEKKSDLVNIPLPMFSLNDVLRESMRKLNDYPGVIVRCEQLPYVKGNSQEMTKLFQLIIDLITDKLPLVPKLFLYVDCDEGKTEVNLEKDFKKYIIKFYTNIPTDDSWKKSNREVLEACQVIIRNQKGEMLVNNIKNTGCLFAISLAGKFA